MHGINITERTPGKWRARVYTKKDGYVSAGQFPSLEEAERAALALQEKLTGRAQSLTEESTFSEVADRFLILKMPRVKVGTHLNYSANLDNHVRPRWGRVPINDIKNSDLAIWVDSFESVAVRRAAYLLVSGVLKVAIRDGLVRVNPLGVEGATAFPESTKLTYSVTDVWKMIEALPEPFKLIATVQFGTSARIGEVLALDWSDVDFANESVSITKHLTRQGIMPGTKTGPKKIRTVWVNNWALDALKSLRGIGPVFLNASGTRMRNATVHAAWGPVRAVVDLPRMVPQDLRHVSLTEHQRQTGDMVATMKRAGHSDQRSMLTYQHAPTEKPAAMDEFSLRMARPA